MKDKSLRLCGVYTILNIKNGKRYIGGSSNVEHRMQVQKQSIKNGDCTPLMRADLKEYGSKYFKVFLIEFCTREELCEKENHYMEKYKTRDRNYGYNRYLAHECDYTTQKPKERECKDKAVKTIGQAIKESRTSKGLTQSQLGGKIGRSRTQIADIERDRNDPNWEIVCKIARELEMDLDSLVNN